MRADDAFVGVGFSLENRRSAALLIAGYRVFCRFDECEDASCVVAKTWDDWTGREGSKKVVIKG